MRTLLLTAALTAVVLHSITHCRRTHVRRKNAKPRTQPEHLQTWEGEGGGLPTAPQTVQPGIAPMAPNPV